MPTAVEARHWGATYALYRVCVCLFNVFPYFFSNVASSFATGYNSIVSYLQARASTGMN
jgi:hypothetical protein